MIDYKFPSNSIVLLKVDYNISSLQDTFRIKSTLPTINQLSKQNNKVVIVTHFGRPKNNEKEFSTKHLLSPLGEILESKVVFIDQYQSFDEAKALIEKSKEVFFLLENTRFSDLEDSQNKVFRLELAKKYSTLANFYVDEAFSVSHRKEVTNTEIKDCLENSLGMQYQKETSQLSLLKDPKKQFYIYMGGAKVETKLPLIKSLLNKADKVFLGGKLCFTFLKAAEELGERIPPLFDGEVQQEFLDEVRDILTKHRKKIILPVDLVYESSDNKLFPGDIGSLTANIFCNEILNAQTIFWNGAFGHTEVPTFAYSTKLFISRLVESNDRSIFVGGGDTETLLSEEIKNKLTFVSTGGGATLDFISKL
ncbi:MAG: phosphoglycerate kinase [Patescibacteria group bacterium]